jgi:hypothetical protein
LQNKRNQEKPRKTSVRTTCLQLPKQTQKNYGKLRSGKLVWVLQNKWTQKGHEKLRAGQLVWGFQNSDTQKNYEKLRSGQLIWDFRTLDHEFRMTGKNTWFEVITAIIDIRD